jgi:rhodanese-related sulfurtransferase
MVTSVAQMITEARTEIEQVSPEAAAGELAAGAVVVDVREPVEWEQYVTGAIQVPRGLLEFVADPASPRYNAALDPSKRVIVYCASGARAALATLTLKRMGYPYAANLDGGFKAWQAAGLPTSGHHDDI